MNKTYEDYMKKKNEAARREFLSRELLYTLEEYLHNLPHECISKLIENVKENTGCEVTDQEVIKFLNQVNVSNSLSE